MKIVIYGLTITSSWGNGHATTYRSLARALAAQGHKIHFIEKDVEWYRNNRDLPEPPFCTVQFYDEWHSSSKTLLQSSKDADVIVIGSYFSDAVMLTQELLARDCGPLLFYDIDTPVTLSRLRKARKTEYLEAESIPLYDAYLSFTGGPSLRALEEEFGSPYAVPLYCSVDVNTYKPTETREAFRCDLSYLGTYSKDRQPKLMKLLGGAADQMFNRKFLVAGAQYPEDTVWAPNIGRIIHVSPPEHPAFYSSSRFTLNLTRDDMVAAGYSPSVRLFEASACGAAILSDKWMGMEQFLLPGEEVLLPDDAYDIKSILNGMSDQERINIGRRARERILTEHSAEHRAQEFEAIVEHVSQKRPSRDASITSAKEEMQKAGFTAASSS
ncbi:MAG TPA: glycosyltransferase [Edaphobacter sp.]|nr:glycosyltransferase [Edaphobacter sp.]